MIEALRQQTQQLTNLLSTVDSALAETSSLPDLEAAKALVELSRMATKADKLKARLLMVGAKTSPATTASGA
jgi:hypothetical protein